MGVGNLREETTVTVRLNAKATDQLRHLALEERKSVRSFVADIVEGEIAKRSQRKTSAPSDESNDE